MDWFVRKKTMVEVPPAGSKRRSAYCPELLVLYKIHKVSPLISEKSNAACKNYLHKLCKENRGHCMET